jgi:hypothetical protein
MNTEVREACAFGAELSLYAVTAPFSAIAAEHRAVDVSISMIRCIVYRNRLMMFGRMAFVVDSMIGNRAESEKKASFMSVNM